MVGKEGPEGLLRLLQQCLHQCSDPDLAIRSLLAQTMDHPHGGVQTSRIAPRRVSEPRDQGGPIVGEIGEPSLDKPNHGLDEQVHGITARLERPERGLAWTGLVFLRVTGRGDPHPHNSTVRQEAPGPAEPLKLPARYVQKLEKRLELPLLDGAIDLELANTP